LSSFITGRDNHFTQETKVQIDRKYRSKRSRRRETGEIRNCQKKGLIQEEKRGEDRKREYCMEAVVG